MKRSISIILFTMLIGLAWVAFESDKFHDWWMDSGGLVGIFTVDDTQPVLKSEIKNEQKIISSFRDALMKSGLVTISRVNMILGENMLENESFQLKLYTEDDNDGYYIQVMNADLSSQEGKKMIGLISADNNFNGADVITNGSLILFVNRDHPYWTDISKIFINL